MPLAALLLATLLPLCVLLHHSAVLRGPGHHDRRRVSCCTMAVLARHAAGTCWPGVSCMCLPCCHEMLTGWAADASQELMAVAMPGKSLLLRGSIAFEQVPCVYIGGTYGLVVLDSAGLPDVALTSAISS